MGNPHEMSVRQLAEQIRDLLGSDSPITYHALPEDDPKVRQPDITRARQLLGWEPTVPIAEGLQETINDFRQRLRVADRS
jgi:nucleoside-diphosphate-sugar epimerase